MTESQAAPFNPIWHAALGALNRVFMVPALRAGLGPLLVNPLGGYLMVLVSRGRRSGRRRYAPLDYSIVEGAVYCLAGFGERTQWLRNVRTEPRVELLLPGRRISGTAAEVTDRAERARAAREVLKAGGFAGFLAGCNPWTAPDAVIERCLTGVPVVRIRPDAELAPGPFDPGGRAWIPVQALLTVLSMALLGRLVHLARRGRAAASALRSSPSGT